MQVLRAQLRRALPERDFLSVELVSYHQDRDEVLLLRKDQPSRFTVIHLTQQAATTQLPALFDGSFSDFAAREQKRHEIKRRMIETPNHVPGICPVCFAAVIDEGCCGIWTGSTKSRASNGPLHHTTCKKCRSLLIAMPTNEDADAGVFQWEFSKWGDDDV